ncbi:DUF3775 domain-containing protein [Roseomonas sp. BN140053]|uniref:DUF3775 domain-containing protein n=1 Tax=Roseomonas sp. BN140053 TaxID=3391898 RepID=UPI0039E9B53C
MSDRPDPNDEVDLGIAVPTVVTVIDAARAVDEMQEDDADEDLQDEEAADDSDPEAAAEALEALIDELNEDEQASLVALAWIGRGDYDAEDWDEALRLAKERNERSAASTYLMGLELLGDLLSEGLEAFGISAEEVAR